MTERSGEPMQTFMFIGAYIVYIKKTLLFSVPLGEYGVDGGLVRCMA